MPDSMLGFGAIGQKGPNAFLELEEAGYVLSVEPGDNKTEVSQVDQHQRLRLLWHVPKQSRRMLEYHLE